jgi:hypothetical protein
MTKSFFPTNSTIPTNVYNIFAITEYAGEGSDTISVHTNGVRIGNSGLQWTTTGSHMGAPSKIQFASTVNDGITWETQKSYVTSIGGWAPSNNQIYDTGDGGSARIYRYGEHRWDGDIAEVLVFNEKLSNSQMALVEGYLSWKYGLQETLNHKSGSGDHPYRYQAPPAVGANSAPDYIDY